MKQISRSAAALAATVLLIPGCRTEFPEQSLVFPEKEFQVHFIAQEIGTRTVFSAPEQEGDDLKYPVLWSGNEDKIAVSLNLAEPLEATVEPSESGKSAEFSASFPAEGQQAPFVFYAMSPLSAYVSVSADNGGFLMEIPATQTPVDGSCDEVAMILAASQTADSPSAFSSVDMHFAHVTAYGKLTLKNMHIPASDIIQSVTLSTNLPLAGQFYYYNFEECRHADEYSTSITVNTESLTATASRSYVELADIWFACAPADLGGYPLTIEVTTSGGKLTRTVDIPREGLSFSAGRISKFSVNMADAEYQSSDPIMENEAFGAYLSEGNHTWAAGSQISREYKGDGTLTFALITPSILEIAEFSGIPTEPVVADSFTLHCNIISGGETTATDYNVTIVQVDGSKVWLSAGEGNGFIVKK